MTKLLTPPIAAAARTYPQLPHKSRATILSKFCIHLLQKIMGSALNSIIHSTYKCVGICP